jgi:hypothetical protein
VLACVSRLLTNNHGGIKIAYSPQTFDFLKLSMNIDVNMLRSDLIPTLLKSTLPNDLRNGSFLCEMAYKLAENDEKGIISTLSGEICNILICINLNIQQVLDEYTNECSASNELSVIKVCFPIPTLYAVHR